MLKRRVAVLPLMNLSTVFRQGISEVGKTRANVEEQAIKQREIAKR
ncbi:hypothetical protein N9Z53_00425 [Mariniblastus sp.]|nr:hypothetical protein [bacterium]MDB4372215.1 hypothetical protein [Mariniblastus sp.]